MAGMAFTLAEANRAIDAALAKARDELAVLDTDGPHAVMFPCRRILHGWVKAETRKTIDVRPTHWREWASEN
jgi:hypothetical protein